MGETYTIKQIADEIGVNKMKVYRFIQKENVCEHHIDARTKHYDENARTTIIKAFSEDNRYKENVTPEHPQNDVVGLLKESIEVQNKELEQKNLQLEKMQTLVDQQQQLSLQDKKQLEEYKEIIMRLNVPNSSSQTFEKDSSIINHDVPKTSENAKEEAKNKRWWNLWKKN